MARDEHTSEITVFITLTLVGTVPGKQAAIFVYPKGIEGNKIDVISGFFLLRVFIVSLAASCDVNKSVPTGR